MFKDLRVQHKPSLLKWGPCQLTDGSGHITTLISTSIVVLLDTGTTLSYVPVDALNVTITYLGAIDDTAKSGFVLIDCRKLMTDADNHFTFGFGSATVPSAIINVPIAEMILPYPDDSVPPGSPFQSTCIFGMSKGSKDLYVLEDTLLRSSYVVHDIANNQIGLAQNILGVTTSDFVEIEAGSSRIPALSGVASPSKTETQTQISSSSTSGSSSTGTQSSTPTTTTTTSGSTGDPSSKSAVIKAANSVSNGVIAGIVVAVLVGLLVALGILDFTCLRRRRRTTSQDSNEPSRGSELPTAANTHEVSETNKHVILNIQ